MSVSGFGKHALLESETYCCRTTKQQYLNIDNYSSGKCNFHGWNKSAKIVKIRHTWNTLISLQYNTLWNGNSS